MDEQNIGTQNPGTETQQDVKTETTQQNPQQQAATQPVAEQKKPGWFRRNIKWFGPTLAAVAAGTATTFAAYKKGKKAGTQQIPVQQDTEDYSLNPNN